MGKTNFRVSLAAACLLHSVSSYAGLDVTPGNVEQPTCATNRIDPLRNYGKVITKSNSTAVVSGIRSAVGESIGVGDVVYYVTLKDARRYYVTEKQIEIIDKSPLTGDVAIVPNQKYPVQGAFFAANGRKYDLIKVGTGFNAFYTLVTDSGFVCSNRLDETQGLKAVGMPTTYQESPMKAVIEEIQSSSPRITTIAITLNSFDAAKFTLEASMMINGQEKSRKLASFDLIAGNAKLDQLDLAAQRTREGKLLIKSISEPSDYHLWMENLFPAMR